MEEVTQDIGEASPDGTVLEAQNEGEQEIASNREEQATRTRQPPSYLKDYYCHVAIINPPCTTPKSNISSGTVYPISKFINYDHFTQKHRAYLAELSSHEEPKTYAQAEKHSKW